MVDIVYFRSLVNSFDAIVNKVDIADARTTRATFKQLEIELVNAYNSIISYIFPYLGGVSESDAIFSDLINVRDKLISTFGGIGSTIRVPKSFFETIVITPLGSGAQSTPVKRDLDNLHQGDKSNEIDNTYKYLVVELNRDEASTQTDNELLNIEPIVDQTNFEMDNKAKIEYLRQVSHTVTKSFSGDPLALGGFVRSVKMMQSISDENQMNLLRDFVMTRLEGKALEVVPAEPATIDEIVQALEKYIKPDNSKVISGRMLALRSDRLKATEFAKQTEDLAEAFQRSLIIEGFPRNKAEELSIEKTVEMCKGNARTDYVKSVLASTAFQTPKEAVSKFLVESNNEREDKQVLFFRGSRNRQMNNRFSNNRYNGNGRYFSNRRNNFSNNSQFAHNNMQFGRNNMRRSNRNFYPSRGNNFGNGGYQNRRDNRNDNRYDGQYDNRYDNNYQSNSGRNFSNNRNVRLAENWEAPRQTLGDPRNASNHQSMRAVERD